MDDDTVFLWLDADALAAACERHSDAALAVEAVADTAMVAVVWAVAVAEGWEGWVVPAGMRRRTAESLRRNRIRDGLSITEAQVESAFGPQWRSVTEVLRQCGAMTLDNVSRLPRLPDRITTRPSGRTRQYYTAHDAVLAAMRYQKAMAPAQRAVLAAVHWDCVDPDYPGWDDAKAELIAPWTDVFGPLPLIDFSDLAEAELAGSAS